MTKSNKKRKIIKENKSKKVIYIERSSSIISRGFIAYRVSTSDAFKFSFYNVPQYTWGEKIDYYISRLPLVRNAYSKITKRNIWKEYIKDTIPKYNMGIDQEYTFVDIKNDVDYVNCSKDSSCEIKTTSSPEYVTYEHEIDRDTNESMTSVIYSRYSIIFEFTSSQLNVEEVSMEIKSFLRAIIS